MTIIEFYDKNALDNIAGALICRPEQIVLLGSNWYQMKNSSVAYKRVLRQNGISTDIKIVAVNKNDLSGVVEKLEQIVAETDECILDITGGDDVYLTAAGIIMERYKDKAASKTISIKDILTGASNLKAYYSSNSKLPESVTAGGIKFTLPEFLYLMWKQPFLSI